MTVYGFELRDGTCGGITDESGVSLPDRKHALEYAQGVARELMNCQEKQTRHWQLDVYDGAGERIFEVPFASLDRTLDHLRPEYRHLIARHADRIRSVKEVVASARITSREARALVSRSRGRPYLAAERGARTIRD
jgi:hypothetical protein